MACRSGARTISYRASPNSRNAERDRFRPAPRFGPLRSMLPSPRPVSNLRMVYPPVTEGLSTGIGRRSRLTRGAGRGRGNGRRVVGAKRGWTWGNPCGGRGGMEGRADHHNHRTVTVVVLANHIGSPGRMPPSPCSPTPLSPIHAAMNSPPGPPLFPGAPAPDPVQRIRTAAARIRQLRGLVGSEGLTPAGTRSLLDELTTALEACALGLESVRRDTDAP